MQFDVTFLSVWSPKVYSVFSIKEKKILWHLSLIFLMKTKMKISPGEWRIIFSTVASVSEFVPILNSATVALHHSLFKIILMHFTLGLDSSSSVWNELLAPPHLCQLVSVWLPLFKRFWEGQIGISVSMMSHRTRSLKESQCLEHFSFL